MSRMNFASLVVLFLAGLSAETARGQTTGPRVGIGPSGPTVSPYINLLRGGNSAALNYYGLVRPQIQTNNGLQALNQQFALSQAVQLPGAAGAEDVVITGHASVFMNLAGYFQSATGGLNPARSVPAPGGSTGSSAAATRPSRPAIR
jgi:hypothetical protein